MPRNIEIKARISPQRYEPIRSAALSLSSPGASETLSQRDTFYRVPFGRLKLREFEHGVAELIAYERPDRAGPKPSSYVIFPCTDPLALHEALALTLGIRGIVEKRREVIHVGQTRVHLDEVSGLGTFLELEVVLRDAQSTEEGVAIAERLMGALNVPFESLVDGAYLDLLEAASAARGAQTPT